MPESTTEPAPASERPAPGSLQLVQDFVNTYDVETGDEPFTDPEVLGRWLSAHDLLEEGQRVRGRADLARAIELRETLRALLLANHDAEPPDPDDLDRLNELASGTPMKMRFDAGGSWQLEPAGSGVDAALARIVGAVAQGMSEGTWARLKACAMDSCQWAFYDHSRNRSGKWCSMRVCGNRAKVRAFRERRSD